MPVTVIFGGQFGSEGKGKVALELVRRAPNQTVVVRVGGTNSGHTGYDRAGNRHALRQIPAGAIDGNSPVILPAGSYIDVEILRAEMERLRLGPEIVKIHPDARIITDAHKKWEAASLLGEQIGSTQSGTGAAVLASTARGAVVGGGLQAVFAKQIDALKPMIIDTTEFMRRHLDNNGRVVIEGTQGFGLSVLHGGEWPKATSRDTSAAGFVSEAGLSPFDVDEVAMVLRSFPIRVAGDSGDLPMETDWRTITSASGSSSSLIEYTTVTGRVRRVGRFDAAIVRRAIANNRPNMVFLNHLDYVDQDVKSGNLSLKARAFVDYVQDAIDLPIDGFGISPNGFLWRDKVYKSVA